MSCLVVFKLPGNIGIAYESWDLIEVLPAEKSPGATVELNDPVRFGFLYITDRDAHEVSHLVKEDWEDEDGDIIKKRRWRLESETFPDEDQYLSYRSFDDPQAVKVTWDSFKATNIHDKYTD